MILSSENIENYVKRGTESATSRRQNRKNHLGLALSGYRDLTVKPRVVQYWFDYTDFFSIDLTYAIRFYANYSLMPQ